MRNRIETKLTASFSGIVWGIQWTWKGGEAGCVNDAKRKKNTYISRLNVHTESKGYSSHSFLTKERWVVSFEILSKEFYSPLYHSPWVNSTPPQRTRGSKPCLSKIASTASKAKKHSLSLSAMVFCPDSVFYKETPSQKTCSQPKLVIFPNIYQSNFLSDNPLSILAFWSPRLSCCTLLSLPK